MPVKAIIARQSESTFITALWSIAGYGIKALEGTQTMSEETAEISQDMLEKFVNRKYHWKGLTPSVQMAMARELLRHRAFLRRLKKYEAVNFGGQYANEKGDSAAEP